MCRPFLQAVFIVVAASGCAKKSDTKTSSAETASQPSEPAAPTPAPPSQSCRFSFLPMLDSEASLRAAAKASGLCESEGLWEPCERPTKTAEGCPTVASLELGPERRFYAETHRTKEAAMNRFAAHKSVVDGTSGLRPGGECAGYQPAALACSHWVRSTESGQEDSHFLWINEDPRGEFGAFLVLEETVRLPAL